MHHIHSILCHLRHQDLKTNQLPITVRHLVLHAFDRHFYLDHLITLLLPTFTLNFLLSQAVPTSLTSQHNFWSESATSAISSANNVQLDYLKPATIRTQKFQLFPKLSSIHLSPQRKCKVFHGQGPPSRESTTTERWVNYQLLAVMLLK